MRPISEKAYSRGKSITRLLGLSAIGIFVFFIPISLQSKTSIPLDHMVSWLRSTLGECGAGRYAMGMIVAGAIYPLITGHWKRSRTERIFLLLKWLGVSGLSGGVWSAGSDWYSGAKIDIAHLAHAGALSH